MRGGAEMEQRKIGSETGVTYEEPLAQGGTILRSYESLPAKQYDG